VKNYIGAIDQGTTSTRSWCLTSRAYRAVVQKEHEQILSKPGWVEHDPLEILRRTEEVIADALEQRGLRASDLAAIGITISGRPPSCGSADRQAGCECDCLQTCGCG